MFAFCLIIEIIVQMYSGIFRHQAKGESGVFYGRVINYRGIVLELKQSSLKFAAATIAIYCRCRIDVPVLETLHLLGLLLAVGEAQSSFIVN